MKKVAIQGVAGSFHHEAAETFFGPGVELCPCLSFREIPESILNGRSSAGVMALENTLAGAILPNYMLIDENDLYITGEVFIPVAHHLMALPESRLEQIREVYSHPMALWQCRGFLKRFPRIRRIEYDDTALAARMIAESGDGTKAAIAPARSAELYGLHILASGIQDHHSNTTRFVVLEKEAPPPPAKGKISFKAVLKHRPGALVEFLDILKGFDMNMTKIQSVPIFGRPWEYAFFIDALYDRPRTLEGALQVMKTSAQSLKVLGIYPQGTKPDES
ncbi:MAG: prephenate dehydratase [Chlorobi bacterium]|nr:prephenate dehydratase [Chlorobiota bacterium]